MYHKMNGWDDTKGRVVIMPASYLEGTGFKSSTGDLLSLGIIVVVFNHWMQLPQQRLRLDKLCFLSCISMYYSVTISPQLDARRCQIMTKHLYRCTVHFVELFNQHSN